MESSFRTRVDRAFGFLLESNVHLQASAESESAAERPESSTVAPEFWSVSERAISTARFARTGDEDTEGESDDNAAADYQRFVRMERRGRRREDLTADEAEEEDSEDEERRERKRRRPREFEGDVAVERTEEDEDEEDEVREMRRMIGKDCTLDFEEEEDEYDKVAVGREGAGERMYMREIRGSCIDIFHLPPGHSGALGTFRRDSRANHAAAAARLKEDKEAEARYTNSASNGSPTSSQAKVPSVSSSISCLKRNLGDEALSGQGADQSGGKKENAIETSSAIPGELGNFDKTDEACEEGRSSCLLDQSEIDAARRGCNFGKDIGESCVNTEDWSVMTRKKKKARTVRFAVADDPSEEKGEREAEMPSNQSSLNRISNHDRVPSTVPDHVRNPTRYTHYTLQWSDDEDDNKKNLLAFEAFQALTQEPAEGDLRSSMERPRSITFIPKSSGTAAKANGSGGEKSKVYSSVQVPPSVSFVEAVLEDDLNLKTNEDSFPSNRSTDGKTSRVFRKRAAATLEDDVDNENIDSSGC